MTTKRRSDLASALSELARAFHADPEKLHLAVAVVFSSIYHAYDLHLVIVGGQSAAHWLKAPASRDVDFVSDHYDHVRDDLTAIGFSGTDMRFRLIHPASGVLVELFDTPLSAAGITLGEFAVSLVQTADIADLAVRTLMPGPALVIDPATTFLSYADASRPASGWHDTQDDGTQARDRAMALLELYRDHIGAELSRLAAAGAMAPELRHFLQDAFHLDLGGV